MQKILSFFFLFLSFPSLLFAQLPEASAELQLPVRQFLDRSYRALSLGEKGIIVIYREVQPFSAQSELHLTRYDANLDTLWYKHFRMERGEQLQQTYLHENELYLLFKGKNNYEYGLKNVAIENGYIKAWPYRKIFKGEVQHLVAAKDYAFLGGKAEGLPFVMRISGTDTTQLLLSALPQEDTYVSRLSLSGDGKKLMVFLRGKNSRQKKSFLSTYSAAGKLIKSIVLFEDEKYELRTFRPISLSAENETLVGTYGERRWGEPQGLYFARIENENMQLLKLDFAKLHHFFDYVPEKRRVRTLERYRKRLGEGETNRYGFSCFVNELDTTHDGTLLFSLETYKATYNRAARNFNAMPDAWINSRWGFYPMLSPLRRLPTPYWDDQAELPDRYVYKNALICGIDSTGKLLWDKSINLDEHETSEPIGVTAYHLEKDSLAMMHYDNEMLYHKKQSVQEKSVLEAKEIELKVLKSGERIGERQHEIALHWFDSYYLFMGYQVVKEENDKRQKVFRIVKFKYPNE
jgi:hypothetical protein